ncbi:MAG TPA: trypsin-like serine protease, partial [Terrimicrobiaceae bacterium]|nr:trypsin-like serine protease [Terrimicrobiaceae bacterium]
FREDFGLDLDLNGDEEAINDRIFNLIGDWHNPHTPSGEVAYATMGRWGVPLRAVDAAELEFRQAYLDQASVAIPAWAASHAPSSYAGYYVDHPQGGIIHVGFTGPNQASLVAQLGSSGSLTAPAGRVSSFDYSPQASLTQLEGIAEDLPDVVAARADIVTLLTRSGVDVQANKVSIGALDVATVSNYLKATFGSTAPLAVTLDSNKPVQKIRTRPLDGRLYGGDWISAEFEEEGEIYVGHCSLGFGASEELTRKPNQEQMHAHFAVTAGHCWEKGTVVSRVGRKDGGFKKVSIGEVKRRTYLEDSGNTDSDGEAILLESGVETPKSVYVSSRRPLIGVQGAEPFVPGVLLCTSGTTTGWHCGAAEEPFVAYPGVRGEWVVPSAALTDQGDSGGSVVNPATGGAVGLVSSGPTYGLSPTWMTPLLPVRLGAEVTPGLLAELDAPKGGPFNIADQ